MANTVTGSGTYYYRISAVDSTEFEGAKSYAISVTFVSPSLDMISVAGGTFWMGSNDTLDSGASPQHSVTLGSYNIDKYEITYEKWTEVYNWGFTHGYTDLTGGQNGSNPSGSNNPVTLVNWYAILKWCNARSEKDGLIPVYYTNNTLSTVYRTGQLDLAIEAVQWKANGYRLPTEAEWEFAARGGNKSQGYTYSGSNTIGDVAWCNSNSHGITHSVGTKTANELGIYDMSGNIMESCWDWYGSYSSIAQTNPKGPTSGPYRVQRGSSVWNPDNYCRVSSRAGGNPGDSGSDIGFRCVQTDTVSTFSSSPATPSNLTAAGGNGQVTLKWNKNSESDFLNYRVYMGTDSVTLTLKDSSANSILDTMKLITGLTNGTFYCFRISSLNSARLESGLSFAASAVPNTLPPAPVLVSPLNGASNVSTTPTLLWNSALSATTYRYQVAVDSIYTASSLILSDTIRTDTSRIITRISVGSTYFWRVSSLVERNEGPFSPSSKFTVSHSALIGDYTNDNKIGLDDISFFIKAWQNKDTLIGDIGPATGSAPNFQQLYDGKINFEDLMVLAQMYDWSFVMNPPSFALSKQSGEIVNSNVSIQCDKSTINDLKTHSPYYVRLQGLGTLGAIEVNVFFDPNRIYLDSAAISNRFAQCFTIKNIDKSKGFVSFIVASTDTSQKVSIDGEYLTLFAEGKTKKGKDSLHVLVTMISAQSQKSSFAKESFALDLPKQIPSSFQLEQNYPNPFNPSTTIEFQLPRDILVSLDIFNVLGQKVATLVNETKKAGYYQIQWNGTNNAGQAVATGVYYIRLQSKDFVATKKIMLIR
jgi:formylglycine-generating enzyme required for sulfatase activity